MTTHKLVPVTKEQALKALEDMDDFAGMAVSVNAFGARETLRRFIEQAAPAPSGEAVLWQWRRKGDPWTLDKTFNTEVFATTDDSEVRPLFAHPPAREKAMTTEREAYERLKADSYTADYAGFLQRQSDIEVLWQARAALQSAPGQEIGTPPTERDDREVTLLRAVYEAARRFLRNNGVDRERASAAVDELDDAIERVKNFDGGYDEVDTVWDTTATVEAQAGETAETYKPLTDDECDEFRRLPGSFNDMMRAVHEDGWTRYCGVANEFIGNYYKRKFERALKRARRCDAALQKRMKELEARTGTKP